MALVSLIQNLQRPRRLRHRTTNDLEMQPKQMLDEHEAAYHAPLACLFGLVPAELKRWPGLIAYVRHLEACFQPLLSDDYKSVWSSLGRSQPRLPADCWPLLYAVVRALRASESRKDNSIEELWDDLVRQEACESLQSEPARNGPPPACSIALFAMLCWITMALQPSLMSANDRNYPALAIKGGDYPLKKDIAQRPIAKLFCHFQRTMKTSRWRHSIGRCSSGGSTALHTPRLSFAALYTIGKIRLVWVDDLSRHLDFDVANRKLSIFRFPSFCALTAVANADSPPILTAILQALYGSDDEEEPAGVPSHQIHQEVLMSYRVLFAQTKRSRRLGKKELKALQDKSSEMDDLLHTVCCSKAKSRSVRLLPLELWPVSCQDYDDTLLEQSCYSSQDDFPFFGQRLVKLQEFSMRQQPGRLTDLWRDRRNPLQWYTFWAVLIVGGLSVVLAILQLIVGVLQLIYSC